MRHLRTNTVTLRCMTDEELADWTTFNGQARLRAAPATPCEDCTDAFSAEMRAAGLCTGFPGEQRFCRRCQRWWPDNKRHWVPWSRAERDSLACLVCHRKRLARRTYLRVRTDPKRWAERKAQQRRRDAARMSDLSVRARKNVLDRDRKRLKYQTDPVYHEMILARNRAARARP